MGQGFTSLHIVLFFSFLFFSMYNIFSIANAHQQYLISLDQCGCSTDWTFDDGCLGFGPTALWWVCYHRQGHWSMSPSLDVSWTQMPRFLLRYRPIGKV